MGFKDVVNLAKISQIIVLLLLFLAAWIATLFTERRATLAEIHNDLALWEPVIASAIDEDFQSSLFAPVAAMIERHGVRQLSLDFGTGAESIIGSPQEPCPTLLNFKKPLKLYQIPVGTIKGCLSTTDLIKKAALSPLFLLSALLVFIVGLLVSSLTLRGYRKTLLNYVDQLEKGHAPISSSADPLLDRLARMTDELLQSQKREQKQLSRVQLARQVGHDLKSPLAGLRSLKSTVKDNKTAQDLFDLTLRRLEAVISDLRHLEAENDEAKNKRIQRQLEKSLNDSLTLLNQEHLQMHLDLSDAHGEALLLPEEHLDRVLMNLLTNAAEANAKNIWVHAAQHKNSDHVLLSLSNDGHTLTDDELEQVFERGFSKGKESGEGIGLAYVQDVLNRHESTIRCKKNEKGHVQFELNLKLSLSPQYQNTFQAP